MTTSQWRCWSGEATSVLRVPRSVRRSRCISKSSTSINYNVYMDFSKSNSYHTLQKLKKNYWIIIHIFVCVCVELLRLYLRVSAAQRVSKWFKVATTSPHRRPLLLVCGIQAAHWKLKHFWAFCCFARVCSHVSSHKHDWCSMLHSSLMVRCLCNPVFIAKIKDFIWCKFLTYGNIQSFGDRTVQ